MVIDPAADNEPAIRCYTAVGFQPVGRMRRYERDIDGPGWHDGLLMDRHDAASGGVCCLLGHGCAPWGGKTIPLGTCCGLQRD